MSDAIPDKAMLERLEAMEEVVDLVAEMLANRFTKGAIHGALNEMIGGGKYCPVPLLEKMITKARVRLREAAGRSDAEQLELAVGFFENVIRDESAAVKDKIRAQEILADILGLKRLAGDAGDKKQGDIADRLIAAARKMRESIPVGPGTSPS